ncbi:uncharacterized protein LOC135625642 [Musa acuminata AAA Group]|uniref:uncharacterized protein LOC135625642 n=1 Tax=Musa acuminata AAA Group TaxID=214697 RepID=UPI0031E09673
MAGFSTGRAKRKEPEEVYDDFSYFSLSSPAAKIRRLDADMFPMIEENEATTMTRFKQQLPIEQISTTTYGMPDIRPVTVHSIAACPPNEKGAFVYDSAEATPFLSPVGPNVSFRVSSDLIRGIKNHVFKLQDQTMAKMDDKIPVSNNCLALVPWVPPQATVGAYEYAGSQSGSQPSQEPMEAEEAGAAPMAVEENREQTVTGINVDVIQQWQQHCMAPEFLRNTPSRLMS